MEQYYDIPQIDDHGVYKKWLLGVEESTAKERIHHFVPFANTSKYEEAPTRHNSRYNELQDDTFNAGTNPSSPVTDATK
jgi:hypothetical protein